MLFRLLPLKTHFVGSERTRLVPSKHETTSCDLKQPTLICANWKGFRVETGAKLVREMCTTKAWATNTPGPLLKLIK